MPQAPRKRLACLLIAALRITGCAIQRSVITRCLGERGYSVLN